MSPYLRALLFLRFTNHFCNKNSAGQRGVKISKSNHPIYQNINISIYQNMGGSISYVNGGMSVCLCRDGWVMLER